jgi:RNA polymerase sigma-70 factor, ECF subfamily
MVQAGQEAWPRITVTQHDFIRYLAERLADDVPVVQGLKQLHPDQLYLACACSGGDERAAAAFQTAVSEGIRAALFRMGRAELVEEISQQVLTELLLEGPNGPRGVTKYAGRSTLKAWVAVIAVRAAGRYVAKSRREQPTDDELLLDRLSQSVEAELKNLKDIYRPQFKEAFQGAVNTLSARDRNILRYELLDGMSAEQIARVYAVHRNTLLRWRSTIRNTLFHETKTTLSRELKVSAQEFDSIMRLVQSSLEVSWSRLLQRSE